MNWKWSILIGVSAAFIAGCGLKPQLVHLSPPVNVKAGATDRGSRPVGVAAFDVRADQKLGIITDAHGKKVDVATTGDTAAALYDVVTQGLDRNAFKTKPMGSDDPVTLRVELKELSFNALKQALDFDITLKVDVSAKARNGVDSYERTYTVKQQKPAAGPPPIEETTRMVNDALGQALSDLLADEELANLLTR
jgi:uncharacterized lipoprotein YajG